MTRTPEHVLARLSPAHRAERERLEGEAWERELEAGIRATAARMAAGASHSADPLARMDAILNAKPGSPEAAELERVLAPRRFVAGTPDTFTRVE